MQRRDLFRHVSRILSNAPPEFQEPKGSLDPWKPTVENPWDESAILHFYNRLGFAPTQAEVQSALIRSPQDLLREAMEDEWCTTRIPGPMPGWEQWLYVPPYGGSDISMWQDQEALYQYGKYAIRMHWTGLLCEPGSYLREKLALFWHNHFVVDVEKLYYPKHLYEYMQMLRTYAWGDLKQFAKDITILPAMLIYLDGVRSTKNGLNENYAREMMELFLVGRTDQNGKTTYTQQDIRDIAQALCGWQYWIEAPGPDIIPHYFAEYFFDFDTLRSPLGSDPKIYGLMAAKELGVYKNFVGKIQEDIIDLIFEKRGNEISRHITEKVYINFVCNDPTSPKSQEVIDSLAKILRDAEWKLKPMFEALFLSEHFFDATFRGCLVKSPLELVVGTMRHLNIDGTWERGIAASELAIQMNQILASPPNVKGWPGYHAWIDSSTLTKRNVQFTSILAAGGRVTAGAGHLEWKDEDVTVWAKQFDSYTATVLEFATEVLRKFIVFPFSEEDVTSLLQQIGVAQSMSWATLDDAAKVGTIRSIVGVAFLFPHYQLS
jgi:hypothetical protein